MWLHSQIVFLSQIQLISVNGSNRGPEIQVVEAFALPEGDPVYEVTVRGLGWQNEVQEIKAVAAPASDETEIQVRLSHSGGFEVHEAKRSFWLDCVGVIFRG